MMRNNGGPDFILGMDNGPEFEHELAILHLSVRHEGLLRIRITVATRTAELLDKAQARRTLWHFRSFLPPYTLLVADYFGVPGPDSLTLMTGYPHVYRYLPEVHTGSPYF